jgi:hypothetical protein
MLSRHFAGSLTLGLSLLLNFGGARAALAGDAKADASADPVEKVQKLNRYAMQLFDDLNFALAERTLLEAVGILDKAGLATAPTSLATHGNLAVLYSVGMKNPDKAVAEFKRALAIKPDLKMSKQRATLETEANLARARAEMGGTPVPAPKPATPAKSTTVIPEPKHADAAASGGLKCPGGGEIQAGDDVTLKCLTSELRAAFVVLYYKANGAEEYQVLPMTKGDSSGGVTSWVAKIPGADTNAKWVPMYFEAQNEAGTPLATSGRADSPNVITVKGADAGEAGGRSAADDEDEDGNEEEGEEIDDNNPLARLENQRRRETEGSKGTWMFSLALGSGFGYAAGDSTEAFSKGTQRVGFNSGFAPAYLGHAVVEIGYFVGRNTALSLASRNQWMQGMKYGAARGANSVLLRLLFFTEPEGKVRWYFATAAGGGEGFRLRVNAAVLNDKADATGQTVHDTVQGGPFVAGLGGGMIYKISRRWHWTLDTQVLVGIPKPSSVLDLTTGLRWMH